MTKTNRLWHAHHRMPKNPTAQQRIAWHLAHAANCACRPIPQGVVQLLNATGKRSAS
ncbi:MAG TPA: hypothetical protein VMG60_08805 [Burkholderiaceae bacterium]|nr:hypothetical protein [Burkholderiaceae bacterium]